MDTNGARDITRERALQLLRCGIISYREAAEYLGISRQAAREMAMKNGIDASLARYQYLKRLFQGASPG